MTFPLIAFFALGIERILYGWCYIGTNSFKRSCQNGIVSKVIHSVPKDEDYWRHMQQLGAYVKVFQLSIIIYDLLFWEGNNNKVVVMMIMSSTKLVDLNATQIIAGLVLVVMGQTLNIAAFRALGVKGIYYGYEMGYPMKRVTTFPYNIPLSDPQYWGVLLTIWGLYIAMGATNFLVPCLEVFWYLMSMKVLENNRGKQLFNILFDTKKPASAEL